MKIVIISERTGVEHEYYHPSHFEVCPHCEGAGKHVNPAIDGHGLSQEDFDEDPSFKENYFSGVYDIECECCKGLRVVTVPNNEGLRSMQKARLGVYLEQQQRLAADRNEARHELEMGY
jgi:hypothetical protein